MEFCKGSENTKVLIDCTHLGRNTTGIERITEELFSSKALNSQDIYHLQSSNTLHLIIQQWFGLVFKGLFSPKVKVVTPGFPPSILASLILKKRLIPYIHDLFLLTRQEELNQRAKYYMRPSLAYAVKHLGFFIVNSKKTEKELRNFCKADAEIILYRPVVKNVFNLQADENKYQDITLKKLKIVMLGTVEPRKNYLGALKLFKALQDKLGSQIELHIVGRVGWGDDAQALKSAEGVTCHGYLSAADIKELVESSTFYLSSSHDEGLGLPLLELQYSGIAIVASNILVFQEVLGKSGLLIDVNNIPRSVDAITAFFSDENNLKSQVQRSVTNVEKWNEIAECDRLNVISSLFNTNDNKE
ncbi:glycosyltransferase [Colwellia sp. E2M01]|uniref:glycosyltransferase n=1 Tax=Colwellia sp. E2M01 TaxID=2841561 RepID=UPI001C0993C5|nr:glycosyltransferase [Colwellia sp. E2M01]MBU2870031.1 glycosyltransferase [Colwellia sp. E2M01]